MTSAKIPLPISPFSDDKIKVAFIKFCGMATGGTEKVLQTIAANLDKNKFLVDFYYCDSAPYIDQILFILIMIGLGWYIVMLMVYD